MFRSVTVDGLTVESSGNTVYIYQISGASKSAVNDSVNRLYLPQSITVSGVVKANGEALTVKVSKNNDAFSTVALTKTL
jgi:hypothetical protein